MSILSGFADVSLAQLVLVGGTAGSGVILLSLLMAGGAVMIFAAL